MSTPAVPPSPEPLGSRSDAGKGGTVAGSGSASSRPPRHPAIRWLRRLLGISGRRIREENAMTQSLRVLRWTALAVVVIAVLGYFSLPVYRRVKLERAKFNVRKMEKALARTNLQEAFQSTLVAYRLAPDSPEVVRAIARVTTLARAPEALGFWQRLISMGAATPADRRQFVEFALDLERLGLAEPVLKALIQEDPKNVDLHYLAIRMLRALGRYEDAIKLGRSLVALVPGDSRARFTLGQMLWERGQAGPGSPGRRLLWEATSETNSYGALAVEFLQADDSLTTAECQTLLRRFGAVRQATLPEGLRIVDLRLRLQPEKLTEFSDELTRKVGAGTNAADAVYLALWLSRHRLYTNVLELTSQPSFRTNQAVLPRRLDALAALGQFAEFDHLYDSVKTNLTPSTAGSLHGLRLARAGRPVDAELEFRSALSAAGNHPDSLLYLSQQAERAGSTNIVIEVQKRLLALPGHGMRAARSLLRLVAGTEDLVTKKQTMDFLVTALPEFPALVQEHAYLHVLTDGQIPVAEAEMERLVQQSPEDPDLRLVLAFAKAKLGKVDAAMGLLESGSMDWSKASPRWQAVYVSILGAAGQREAARQTARTIELGKLNKLERELIQAWR